jgi:hypothetical protein
LSHADFMGATGILMLWILRAKGEICDDERGVPNQRSRSLANTFDVGGMTAIVDPEQVHARGTLHGDTNRPGSERTRA